MGINIKVESVMFPFFRFFILNDEILCGFYKANELRRKDGFFFEGNFGVLLNDFDKGLDLRNVLKFVFETKLLEKRLKGLGFSLARSTVAP